jgi:hypothetical protein
MEVKAVPKELLRAMAEIGIFEMISLKTGEPHRQKPGSSRKESAPSLLLQYKH